MKEFLGLFGVEGNLVVVLVEEGWVWAHEDISHDEVLEVGWGSLDGLDSEEALSLSELSDLKDVVFWLEDVFSGVKGEGEVWKRILS